MNFKEYFNRDDRKLQIQNVASILASLFSIPTLSEARLRANENTEKFWTNSRSPLIPWLQKHSISIPSGVPKYAQGGSGRAYFLDKDYVVKMTANRVESNVANIVKNGSDLPTPVIDVLPLPGGFYAILQHHVNTNVPKQIKDAADYLTMIIDDYPEMNGFPQTVQDQQKICSEILVKNGGNKSLLPYMLVVLKVLIHLYHATGFKHDDAGPTNIAMHNGKIVIHDLGPNETGKFNPRNSLNQIHQNRANLGLPNIPEI